LWTADVTDWVKQECVSNWLAHSVENLAEDADDVLHPLLPERNDHDYELRRLHHERGLTMPNAISFTDIYINNYRPSY